MNGVPNRLPGVMCEVGTCYFRAAFTEHVNVIPGDPALRDQRHQIDVVLCQRPNEEFETDGLMGIVTAYGDTITEGSR
jgi:hypothetical protein